jgi:catechol 2,3-dioxygenase-like lactoylglutathione lyase family enzyme
MSTSKPVIQVDEVRTIGVPVTDQDRAISFYVDTLGFDKSLDVPIGEGKRWIVVAPPRGTASIALVASGEGIPAGVETGIRLISHSVDADHAALRAHGVDADEILRWDGVPAMFAFRDQDGNGLEIVEDAGA